MAKIQIKYPDSEAIHSFEAGDITQFINSVLGGAEKVIECKLRLWIDGVERFFGVPTQVALMPISDPVAIKAAKAQEAIDKPVAVETEEVIDAPKPAPAKPAAKSKKAK